MEKLERILHAEEAARLVVSSARDEAQRLANDARTAAARAVREGRESTQAQTADLHARVIADARADANALVERAARDRDAVLKAAEARTSTAVAAVLEVLRER